MFQFVGNYYTPLLIKPLLKNVIDIFKWPTLILLMKRKHFDI